MLRTNRITFASIITFVCVGCAASEPEVAETQQDVTTAPIPYRASVELTYAAGFGASIRNGVLKLTGSSQDNGVRLGHPSSQGDHQIYPDFNGFEEFYVTMPDGARLKLDYVRSTEDHWLPTLLTDHHAKELPVDEATTAKLLEVGLTVEMVTNVKTFRVDGLRFKKDCLAMNPAPPPGECQTSDP